MRQLRALVCAAVLASCGVPTEPPMVNGMPADVALAVIGSWSLATWNANPMPAKYETWFGNDAIADSVTRIAGGFIALNDDATYARTTNWRIDRMDGTAQRSYTTTEQGSYTGSVANGVITLNLYGGVTMRVIVTNTTMSAKYIVQDPIAGTVTLGDVWAYAK